MWIRVRPRNHVLYRRGRRIPQGKEQFCGGLTWACDVIRCCRMTNDELLRWLVETSSRDVEHYQMSTASRSTVRQFNVWRQTLNCLTVTWRSLDIFHTVNLIHILPCFCLRLVCFPLPPSCRQNFHAAILWVKLSETPPSYRQNSHAAILWVKSSEMPPSCRQNSHAAILWVRLRNAAIL